MSEFFNNTTSLLFLYTNNYYARFGWAFLANKAVWHGKSKLKSYGELFRTGDTVTVSLDLDKGGFRDYTFQNIMRLGIV